MVESSGTEPPMQDKDLYQHILGLTSPWTFRECSLGGTLSKSTATIAMRQMGSQYQPDALANESTSIIPPTKNPCWRCGLVMYGKLRWSRGLGVRPFGIFERREQDQLATPTAMIAIQQMGSQYQPDAPARETTSILSPPKNACWRDGLVMHGKPQWSQLFSRLTACRVPGHNRAECCDAEQRENFKKAIFVRCGGLDLYPR